jgi:putative hydrolase of the HAD superfamily
MKAAVLFDLDDTLYPERDFVMGGLRAAAEFLSDRCGSAPAEVEAGLVSILERDGRGHVFDTFMRTAGCFRPERVAAALHVYRSHQPRIQLFPDARPVLVRLRQRGVKLGILTDGIASVQQRKIDALGLRPLVDIIIFTDELGGGFSKPSPVPFQVALDLLCCNAGDAAYVGNDPDKDFAGANQIGMDTIRVRSPSVGFPRGEIEVTAQTQAKAYIEPFAALVEVLLSR